MKGINSVLLDCSFCIRLLKKDDEFHQNCVDYFKYFMENNIEMYLSTIVVSEYAVGDDPKNLLSLNAFRLLEFDFKDARFSGDFLALLKGLGKFGDFGERKVVINDIKLFAQIHNRKIDAYITKDRKSFTKMIDPLKKEFSLTFESIDLTTPLNAKLGRLF
jgi:predicted nucleic acid-binding protein